MLSQRQSGYDIWEQRSPEVLESFKKCRWRPNGKYKSFFFLFVFVVVDETTILQLQQAHVGIMLVQKVKIRDYSSLWQKCLTH